MAGNTSITDSEGSYFANVVFNIYYDGKDRWLLATNDPRFTAEDGSKPGFKLAVTHRKTAADYHPGNWNRLARAAKKFLSITPPDECPPGSRRLKDR